MNFIEGLFREIKKEVREEQAKFDWTPFFQEVIPLNKDELFNSLFEVKKPQIVAFGENHGDVGMHKFFAGLMPDFAHYGVKTIALELQRDFNKNLSLYFNNNSEDYLTPIINWEKEMVKEGHVVAGRYRTKDYFNIVRYAQQNGMRTKVFDVSKKMQQRMEKEDKLHLRDGIMAKCVFKLPKPCAIYVGQTHLCRENINHPHYLGERLQKLFPGQFIAIYSINSRKPRGMFDERGLLKALESQTWRTPFFIELQENTKKMFPFFMQPLFIKDNFDFLLII